MHVVQLHRDIDTLRARGAEVYVIGNGAPSFVEGFCKLTRWQGAIYTDPSLAVFCAAQLKRGVTSTLHPRALVSTLRAFARGGRQGCTQGDQWQQGGVLVIAPGGTIKWHHISAWPGDNASAAQILESLR